MTSERILVVDDDTDDWIILGDAMSELDAAGYVWFALHGTDLLDKLQILHGENSLPDLIILDLNMPKMSGTQLLQNLKADQRFKDIPIIIYSTSVNILEKKACLGYGATAYITKPVSQSESLSIAKYFLSFCK